MEAISTQYDHDQQGWTQEEGFDDGQSADCDQEQDHDMSDLFDDFDDDRMLSRTRAALARAQAQCGEVEILEAQLRRLQHQGAN